MSTGPRTSLKGKNGRRISGKEVRRSAWGRRGKTQMEEIDCWGRGIIGGEMLLRKEGDVWELGGELVAPHYDVGRVNIFFGEQHKVDQFALLEHIARVEVPVNVGPGENPGEKLERELAYGNHSSVRKHAAGVWDDAVEDVKMGRTFVTPLRVARIVRGLRINQVGVVGEKGASSTTPVLSASAATPASTASAPLSSNNNRAASSAPSYSSAAPPSATNDAGPPST